MKKKFENNEQGRLELVQHLVNKELVELKKMYHKYKHIKFLDREIIVQVADLKETTLAQYKNTEEEDGKYRYKHIIMVSNKVIDRYYNYKYNEMESWAGINKIYYKRYISKCIRHELIHAFAYEKFSPFTQLIGINSDGSPFFLSLLHFFKGMTTHPVLLPWIDSPIRKDIEKIKDYDDLQLYLGVLLCGYNNEIKRINDFYNKQNRDRMIKTKGNISQHIFNFNVYGDRNVGLTLRSTGITKYTCVRSKRDIDKVIYHGAYSWFIGCNVPPSMLFDLIKRKMEVQPKDEDVETFIIINAENGEMFEKTGTKLRLMGTPQKTA